MAPAALPLDVTETWGAFFAFLMTGITALTILNAAPPPTNLVYRFLDLLSDLVATLLLIFMQSRLRQAYDTVCRQSKTDALTGCLNKAGFHEQLQAEVDRHKRYRHGFSLAYFDCDNFKQVNDTLGHQTGDALLAEIGRVLHVDLRAVDSAGRLGGDEFAVLLRESGAEAAEHAAHAMKQRLDQAMSARRWPVGFSIGIACFENAPEDADRALAAADAVMYEVKKNGKNGMRAQRF